MRSSLYEATAPVKFKDKCENQAWSSIKTEMSVLNYLAIMGVGFSVGIIYPGAAQASGAVWTPRTVEVSCNSKPDAGVVR
jgi:hypothetical protein